MNRGEEVPFHFVFVLTIQECLFYGINHWIEWSLITNIKHNTGKLKAIAMAEEIYMFLYEGPTSYAPVIEAAIDIVEQSHGQFHVLVIIADGQVNNITFVFVSMWYNSHLYIILFKIWRLQQMVPLKMEN